MNSSAQVDPSPPTRAPPGGGSSPAAPSRSPYRLRLGLQLLLFVAFAASAALPILALSLWNQNAADRQALAAARAQHLLLAQDLAFSLSRYVQDTQAAFALAFESGGMRSPVPGLRPMLAALDLADLCVIGPRDTVEACLGGAVPTQPPIVPASRIPGLRALAAAAHGQPAISPLTRDPRGDPAFYLVMQRPHGRLGVGILTTAYIRHLQRRTAAGANGLTAVVDATGKVIAHPLAAWEQEERDLSDVSDVREMMHGKTGAVRFYGPMTRSEMIGGDSVVPETGWGVIVAQPIAVIRTRLAGEPALVVTLAALAAAALLSQWLAAALARPIRQAAATAEAVRNGNDIIRVPPLAGLAPREMAHLRTALNAMLDELARRTAGTAQALHRAETASIGTSQLRANISHEIRTPLHGVVGMIALLEQTGLTPLQTHYASGARQSGETLVALLDAMLDLSKVEADRPEPKPALFHPPTPGSPAPGTAAATAALATPGTATTTAALARLGRHSVRLLLVEDNAIGIRVTQALLESLGCEVRPARNGQEALAAYRDDHFDIVLMDCQMPGMDGYAAARAIRRIEAAHGGRTPIIALTPNPLAANREACLAAGMDDRLNKPLTLAETTDRLLHWLAPLGARVDAE